MRLVLTEQGAYFHDPDMASYAPDGQARSRLTVTNALMAQAGGDVQPVTREDRL